MAKEQHWFTFLQISFISGLIEDSWVLLSAPAFNLLWYHTLCSLWKPPCIFLRKCEWKRQIMPWCCCENSMTSRTLWKNPGAVSRFSGVNISARQSLKFQVSSLLEVGEFYQTTKPTELDMKTTAGATVTMPWLNETGKPLISASPYNLRFRNSGLSHAEGQTPVVLPFGMKLVCNKILESIHFSGLMIATFFCYCFSCLFAFLFVLEESQFKKIKSFLDVIPFSKIIFLNSGNPMFMT